MKSYDAMSDFRRNAIAILFALAALVPPAIVVSWLLTLTGSYAPVRDDFVPREQLTLYYSYQVVLVVGAIVAASILWRQMKRPI